MQIAPLQASDIRSISGEDIAGYGHVASLRRAGEVKAEVADIEHAVIATNAVHIRQGTRSLMELLDGVHFIEFDGAGRNICPPPR